MQIDTQALDFELTEGMRAHLLHRLHFALWRFRDRIARVTVRLSDLNGPRGGLDKVCCLRLRLHGMPDVLIEDTEEDLYIAMSRAADRAGRTLVRRLRRSADLDAHEIRSRHERID